MPYRPVPLRPVHTPPAFPRALTAAALVLLPAGPALAAEGSAPDGSAATWQMPWQIAPVGPAATASGEQTILSLVPGTGFVKGTTAALQTLGRPLPEAPGRNRTVDVCRATVQGEATKAGAKEVEAASAGPDKVDRKGEIFAPVLFRLTYDRPFAYEVREATMICVVTPAGGIVDAYIPE